MLTRRNGNALVLAGTDPRVSAEEPWSSRGISWQTRFLDVAARKQRGSLVRIVNGAVAAGSADNGGMFTSGNQASPRRGRQELGGGLLAPAATTPDARNNTVAVAEPEGDPTLACHARTE